MAHMHDNQRPSPLRPRGDEALMRARKHGHAEVFDLPLKRAVRLMRAGAAAMRAPRQPSVRRPGRRDAAAPARCAGNACGDCAVRA
jgi:hypothetical protein